MNRVLRSVFDPVPRPLSPGAQLLVVGLLIVGITISVAEYLESSRPAALAQDQLRDPASLDVGTGARLPSEIGTRARSLVRVSTRPSAPEGTSATGPANDRPFPGTGREPTSAGAAPMSLQPGADG
jgi:hypothetical protein